MIHLVGPGGAGKTTVGAALAARIGVPFVDLDAQFFKRHGDIALYLEADGYEMYAMRNVELYAALARSLSSRDIIALSSGFMTYHDQVHVDYVGRRQRIISSPSTFVLLPSLELEACVVEIVRRQLGRPFARTPEREEEVIRARFPIYAGLAAAKVETLRPVHAAVADILVAIAAQQTNLSVDAAGCARAPLL